MTGPLLIGLLAAAFAAGVVAYLVAGVRWAWWACVAAAACAWLGMGAVVLATPPSPALQVPPAPVEASP